MNTPPIPVNCPRCNNKIGEEINIGFVLIHAGGAVWRELRGYCAQCGSPFYWTASDNQLEIVVKEALISRRIKQLPKKGDIDGA